MFLSHIDVSFSLPPSFRLSLKSVNIFSGEDFFKDIIYLLIYFREREREGERGEKHHCMVASPAPPTGDLACNPGMCPDWEPNQQPFASQSGAQSTEPHQPGKGKIF